MRSHTADRTCRYRYTILTQTKKNMKYTLQVMLLLASCLSSEHMRAHGPEHGTNQLSGRIVDAKRIKESPMRSSRSKEPRWERRPTQPDSIPSRVCPKADRLRPSPRPSVTTGKNKPSPSSPDSRPGSTSSCAPRRSWNRSSSRQTVRPPNVPKRLPSSTYSRRNCSIKPPRAI